MLPRGPQQLMPREEGTSAVGLAPASLSGVVALDHMVLREGDGGTEAGGSMTAHPGRGGCGQPRNKPLQH